MNSPIFLMLRIRPVRKSMAFVVIEFCKSAAVQMIDYDILNKDLYYFHSCVQQISLNIFFKLHAV